MKDRLYLTDFQLYQSATQKQKEYMNKTSNYFELALIPSLRMRCEIAGFITHRSRRLGMRSFCGDRRRINRLGRFLSEQVDAASLRDKPAEVWIKELKKWMLANGYALTYRMKRRNGRDCQVKADLISYFEYILDYLKPEDIRPEHEKDRWELEKLDVPYRANPTVNHRTISFAKIKQDGIRSETKRTVYYLIQYEALSNVINKLGAMNGFSRYLNENYGKINSCGEIDREVIENYLVHINTECASKKRPSSQVGKLKQMLEVLGEICGYDHLKGLFLQREIPRDDLQMVFKAYSDAELKRLNAAITELDEQTARLMLIHQLLGTRISDTLTLERGCLYKKDGETIIRIKQLKTRLYEKPISADLAALICKAEEYTKNRYGETQYIFVNEIDCSQPMQYRTVKDKMYEMIRKNDLRDDHGERFGFGSHLFRHTYGMKLTEMHLDDWTIAKLLGHSGLDSVKHYRRMSNQVLADETREIRRKMSEIILANLDGWEEEYEQIRHHDRL